MEYLTLLYRQQSLQDNVHCIETQEVLLLLQEELRSYWISKLAYLVAILNNVNNSLHCKHSRKDPFRLQYTS